MTIEISVVNCLAADLNCNKLDFTDGNAPGVCRLLQEQLNRGLRILYSETKSAKQK